jgi:hypothetical protein
MHPHSSISTHRLHQPTHHHSRLHRPSPSPQVVRELLPLLVRIPQVLLAGKMPEDTALAIGVVEPDPHAEFLKFQTRQQYEQAVQDVAKAFPQGHSLLARCCVQLHRCAVVVGLGSHGLLQVVAWTVWAGTSVYVCC